MTAGSESPARGSRPFWGIARFSLPGLSELTVASSTREPEITSGRAAWEPCESGAGRGEVSLQNSQTARLTSRVEESDPVTEMEDLVGSMFLGVSGGVFVIGLITFMTWALGLAQYTRAW